MVAGPRLRQARRCGAHCKGERRASKRCLCKAPVIRAPAGHMTAFVGPRDCARFGQHWLPIAGAVTGNAVVATNPFFVGCLW